MHLVQGDVFDFNLEQLLSISRHFHRHFSAIYLDPLWSERHRFSLQHPDFLSMLKLLLGMIDSDGLSLVVLRATQHWDQVAYGLPAPSYTRSAGKVGERFLFWRSRTASVAEANVLHDFSAARRLVHEHLPWRLLHRRCCHLNSTCRLGRTLSQVSAPCTMG